MVKIQSVDETVQENLNVVIGETINHYLAHVYPGICEIIKMKTGYTADIEREIAQSDLGGPDNSYYIYPILEPNMDAFIANAYEIDTMIRPIPITADEDAIQASSDASDVTDYFEAMVSWKDIEDIMREEAAIIGTSYARHGYQKKGKSNLPDAYHVSFFEMFVEPGAKDFYKSRYKIHRKIMSTRQIMSSYGNHLKKIELPEGYDDVESYISSLNSFYADWDFNQIWNLKFFEESINSKMDKCTAENIHTPWDLFQHGLSTQFKMIDPEDPNTNHEVVEVWDGGKMYLVIGREVLFSSDLMDQAPFTYCVHERQPGTYLGRGLGQKLMPLQKDANFIYNSLRRAIRQNVFPDTMSVEGALLDPITNMSPSTLTYSGGKNYKYNSAATLGGRPFEKIVYSDYDTIALLKSRLLEIMQEASITAGTNSYTLGGQGKIERTAGGVAQRNAVHLARLKPLSSSLRGMKGKAFYIWMEIANRFLDKDILIKVDSNGSTTLKDINIDDILNKTIVQVDTDSNKSIRRYENIELGSRILGNLAAFSNTPDGQQRMMKVLDKVIEDYVYDGETSKIGEQPVQDVPQDPNALVAGLDPSLIGQQQVDDFSQTPDINSLIGNVPIDLDSTSFNGGSLY